MYGFFGLDITMGFAWILQPGKLLTEAEEESRHKTGRVCSLAFAKKKKKSCIKSNREIKKKCPPLRDIHSRKTRKKKDSTIEN